MQSIENRVTRIETIVETEIAGIKEDVSEIKIEQKEFHEKIGEKIDDVAHKIQELSGLTQMVNATQVQGNASAKWIAENAPIIQEMIDERKDTKRRIRDAAFKWGLNLMMFVLMLYFFYSSQVANKNLIKTFEKGIVIEQIN